MRYKKRYFFHTTVTNSTIFLNDFNFQVSAAQSTTYLKLKIHVARTVWY